ncbi:MAG: OmpA family protein [Proteobacteria bacterium]|nr:OmpA family protein [Pseudomonadota bacterium]
MRFNNLIYTTALTVAAITAVAGQAHAYDEMSFRQYLAQRYEFLALDEDSSMDIEDSEYLREAQSNALHGGPIMPHPLDNVHFVQSTQAELQNGHDLLVAAGQNGAAEKMPAVYARALSAYDCWVEQQEGAPNIGHNIQDCKGIYLANAAQLQQLASVKAVQPVAVVEKLRTLHSVYFDWNVATLSASEKAKLDKARAMLTDARNGRLIIRGFADTSGNAGYNMGLSKERANNVARYLNLPNDRFEIRTVGYGETNLHVPTADGVRNASNRVVDISINATKVDVQ